MDLFVIERWIYASGPHTVIIWCPSCGQRLGLPHNVDGDGVVTPSVVCTHDGCSFHEWVSLKDYPNVPMV